MFALLLVLTQSADVPDSYSRYIVMFKRPENVAIASTEESLVYTMNVERSKKLFGEGDRMIARLGNGYIGQLSHSTMQKIEHDPAVAVLEKDQEVSILKDFQVSEILMLSAPRKETQASDGILVQKGAPWGISRLSSRVHPTAKRLSFRYPANAGKGTKIFVIDTGIEVNHPEFEGRAHWGINLIEGSPDTDENGHGTHCAGVIAGAHVGIAKKAKVVAVKALDRDGGGVVSNMILGLDFVMREHSKEQEKIDRARRRRLRERGAETGFSGWKRRFVEDFRRFDRAMGPAEVAEAVKRMENELSAFEDGRVNLLHDLERQVAQPKTVVNMSIGGIKSRALNLAMEYASNIGIHFSAAAGNDSEDACEYSPGSSRAALTVGASNRFDQVAFFSNYGDCVDVYAPGFDILSAWIGGRYRVASGTSMAAPHVSGVMALYLDENSYMPHELTDKIMEDAPCVIEDNYQGGQITINVSHFNLIISEQNTKLPLVTIEKLLSRMRKRHHVREVYEGT